MAYRRHVKRTRKRRAPLRRRRTKMRRYRKRKMYKRSARRVYRRRGRRTGGRRHGRTLTKTFLGVASTVAVAQGADLKSIYRFKWDELQGEKLRTDQGAIMERVAGIFQKFRVLHVKTVRYHPDPVNAQRVEPFLTKRWCKENFAIGTYTDPAKLTPDMLMLNAGAKCRRWNPRKRWTYMYRPRWTDNAKPYGGVEDYSIAPRSKKKWFQTNLFNQIDNKTTAAKLEPASTKRFEIIQNEGERTVKYIEYKAYTLQFANMDFDMMN